MSKVGLIIRREYLTRVRKRSFLLLTLGAPILFAGFFALVIWIALQEKSQYKVWIVDDNIVNDSTAFIGDYIGSENIIQAKKSGKDVEKDWKYKINKAPQKTLADNFEIFRENEDVDFLMHIPSNIVSSKTTTGRLYFKKPPGTKTELYLNKIVNNALTKMRQENYGIDSAVFDLMTSRVEIKHFNIDEVNDDNPDEQKDSIYKYQAYIGVGFSFLIYLFIFMFAGQVMKGVIEEKTNRIVEIIVSSVKPFQLMMGKIVGVALVGLTQFLVWILFSGILFFIVSLVFSFQLSGDSIPTAEVEQFAGSGQDVLNSPLAQSIKRVLTETNWLLTIVCFIFFFLTGYLLYGSLFAAVGSAVDNETDSQQYLIPLSLPLIAALYICMIGINQPDNPGIIWASYIPFTSPVAMMVRVPMGLNGQGPATWELLLSMVSIILTIIAIIWMSGKIYRIGILMHGKKVKPKELIKWIFYK